MKRSIWGMLIMAALVVFVFGCAEKSTPKGAIVKFFKALKGGDEKAIAESISFEKLLVEKMGDSYDKLSPEEKSNRIEEMRSIMVESVTRGSLSFLGGIDPEIEKIDVTGDQARAFVYNGKNKEEQLVFMLKRENGVWKIFSISTSKPA